MRFLNIIEMFFALTWKSYPRCSHELKAYRSILCQEGLLRHLNAWWRFLTCNSRSTRMRIATEFKLWDQLWVFVILVVGWLLSCYHVAPHGISAFCFHIFKKVKMTTTLDWWSHIWMILQFLSICEHIHIKNIILGDDFDAFIHEKTIKSFILTFTVRNMLFSPGNIGLREIELHWVLDGEFVRALGFVWVSSSCCVVWFCGLDVGLKPFRYPQFE